MKKKKLGRVVKVGASGDYNIQINFMWFNICVKTHNHSKI